MKRSRASVIATDGAATAHGAQRSRIRCWVALAAAALAAAALAAAAIGVGTSMVAGSGRSAPAVPTSPSTTTVQTTPTAALHVPPLRADASWPVIDMTGPAVDCSPGEWADERPPWSDDRLVDPAYLDITEVSFSCQRFPAWGVSLREGPPRTWRATPTPPIIEYGIVFDTDGDRVADCHIGLNSDAPRGKTREGAPRAEVRVWVTNLKSGLQNEQVGPPYGWPVEFGNPLEGGLDQDGPTPTAMSFSFLLDPSALCPFGAQTHFYVYASSMTRNGQSLAFAPANAWLGVAWKP